MQEFQVGKRRLTVQKTLGQGAFGVVYQVKDKAISEAFALKDIRCENNESLNNAVSEAESLLKVVSHKNILTILGVDTFSDEFGLSHFLISTELCSGGSLNERLTRQSSDEMNLKWMSQISDALSYLHMKGMVHRDLKPENVLLADKEDVKLADYGLIREYIALKRANPVNEWLTFYKQYYMNTLTGTPSWIAPEVFNSHYTEKADVFSLGVIFFAILERDYVIFEGKRFYGAFVSLDQEGKVGLGYAMSKNQNTKVTFSPESQGSSFERRATLDALSYSPKDRPSAEEVHKRIQSAQGSLRLKQKRSTPKEASGWCC